MKIAYTKNMIFQKNTVQRARRIFYPVQGCDSLTKTERGSGAGPPARSRCATPTANLPFPQNVFHSRDQWEPLRSPPWSNNLGHLFGSRNETKQYENKLFQHFWGFGGGCLRARTPSPVWRKSGSPEDDALGTAPSGRPGGRRREVHFTTSRHFLDSENVTFLDYFFGLQK